MAKKPKYLIDAAGFCYAYNEHMARHIEEYAPIDELPAEQPDPKLFAKMKLTRGEEGGDPRYLHDDEDEPVYQQGKIWTMPKYEGDDADVTDPAYAGPEPEPEPVAEYGHGTSGKSKKR